MHPPSSAAVSTSTIPGVLDIFFEIFLEASSIAATPAFMSDDPRPYSRSPCVSPANGSRVHALTPSGTTSRWPVRHSGAFEGDPPARAITLVRASAYSWYSTRKPHCSRSAPACLNSSHRTISYAVFCLKKKDTPQATQHPTAPTPVFLAENQQDTIAETQRATCNN